MILYYKHLLIFPPLIQVGDPIWTINNQNIIGYLSMPRSLKAGICELSSPVTYMQSNTSNCNYNSIQASQCNAATTPFLSYNSYLTSNILLLKVFIKLIFLQLFFTLISLSFKNANSLYNCIQQNNIGN